MIKLSGIYTIRDTPQPYYWDIVFEWEDEFSRTLGIPLINVGKRYDQIYRPSLYRKVLNRLDYYRLKDKYFFNPEHYFLAFHIGPPGVYSFHTRRNVIPIIIDFWKHENLKRFNRIFSSSVCVFVTSREVFNFLVNKGRTINLQHTSLSIPDKYLSAPDTVTRSIDIIQLGRQNSKLVSFMNKLLDERPDIHYVHAELINGQLCMISNKNGNLGSFASRGDFIGLLRKSKISLLSAPGLDEDVKRTAGFSPVTPRFLESAALGCRMLGVYPDNDDFDYYRIGSVCHRINSYEEFRTLVLRYLSDLIPTDYSEFINNNLCSHRAKELLEKLNTL